MRIIDFKKQPSEASRYIFFDNEGHDFWLPIVSDNYIKFVKTFDDYCNFIYSLINHIKYLNENDDEFLNTAFKNYSKKHLKQLYEKYE